MTKPETAATIAPARRSDADLDRLHDDVVARFPKGLTPQQFRQVTLESADEDGRLYPHTIADFFHRYSLLFGMLMDGLIVRRCKPSEAGPWFITDKGRAVLIELQATP